MHPFIAHLIGDFIIQNDWMAARKKGSALVTLVHTLTYLIPFLITGLNWWQISLIGATHFVQDRSTFVNWWLKNWKKMPESAWGEMSLIVDQIFHILTIQIIIELPKLFA